RASGRSPERLLSRPHAAPGRPGAPAFRERRENTARRRPSSSSGGGGDGGDLQTPAQADRSGAVQRVRSPDQRAAADADERRAQGLDDGPRRALKVIGESDRSPDAVVVGGGFAGLAAATA